MSRYNLWISAQVTMGEASAHRTSIGARAAVTNPQRNGLTRERGTRGYRRLSGVQRGEVTIKLEGSFPAILVFARQRERPSNGRDRTPNRGAEGQFDEPVTQAIRSGSVSCCENA